jgi:magnesium transporter
MSASLPPASENPFSAADLRDAWPALAAPERAAAFKLLSHQDAEVFFHELSSRDQSELLYALPDDARRLWMRILAPDDAADLVQSAPEKSRDAFLAALDEPTRREVNALLAYAEDDAGGLMNPRFARVRPEMTVDEAISYVRKQARERVATIYNVYVLDQEQHLLGAVSFRDLFEAAADKTVRDVMSSDIVRVDEHADQELVTKLFARHHLLAIPVVDKEARIVGIITIDDAVHVAEEVATEDIQKLGGSEVLGAPYMQMGFLGMVKKRAGWLSALFLGEMLTATAMGYFEGEIAKAVVLALFVPLIISSGGNSGSQATTLVIRAMALGELRLRDWWKLAHREVMAGVVLGVVLGSIGIVRILTWQALFHTYGAHSVVIALTVGVSLVGVVTFGTLAGSMLPFILRRLGFDPASASAPFVVSSFVWQLEGNGFVASSARRLPMDGPKCTLVNATRPQGVLFGPRIA